mmetsp:Transcript_15152/g.23019  ORF Transcript_15152/g.23019 Transcript_15152/m.23019 type:complete len:99 (-) Transcript_15152:463-759(-)
MLQKKKSISSITTTHIKHQQLQKSLIINILLTRMENKQTSTYFLSPEEGIDNESSTFLTISSILAFKFESKGEARPLMSRKMDLNPSLPSSGTLTFSL